ncbi:hypothetical protein FJY90_06155 [Candidatus Gottesmanbacteria bacterium]|nr:hypothetical protein [Candidatus Gottesmanbacteria bacterium]
MSAISIKDGGQCCFVMYRRGTQEAAVLYLVQVGPRENTWRVEKKDVYQEGRTLTFRKCWYYVGGVLRNADAPTEQEVKRVVKALWDKITLPPLVKNALAKWAGVKKKK